ncbi:FUSC family protein [Luteococcus sp. Sow4_B9]|uniref:FUSC family protein n=1 Tax=Luteococcus sp. Sow4_B9 TaxID=3438792 RepID=UPI003F9E7897
MKNLGSRILDLLWPTRPTGRKEALARLAPIIGNMAKLAIASTLAYLLTRALVHGPIDLTSSLTALLVMQASAASTFKKGALRVVAVSSGVSLALLTTYLFGMNWWSLGLVIFCALFLARLLRLGDSALEMPISAMLILGQGTDVAAETRVIATLIGTLVGIVFPLILPPAVPFRSAASAVHGVATEQRNLLERAAEALENQQVTRPVVAGWLTRARQITKQVASAQALVDRHSDLRRFNSRAMGTADISPILLSGLNSLDSCLLSLRGIFLVMERHAPPPVHPSMGATTTVPQPFDEDVQHVVAMMLRRLGDFLEAFGTMVEAEANGNEEKAHATFVANYRQLRDARAEIAELMAAADNLGDQWLLSGGVLASLDQILEQLDIDSRVRVRDTWKASQLGRRLPESQIGPRTTMIDRARLTRMRARQLKRKRTPTTVVDFLDDDETTAIIPVIDPDAPPPQDAKPSRRLRLHRRQ